MKVAEHIALKKYTTFKIGGEARFFVVVKTIDELKEAVQYAKDNKLTIFPLGGGSNVLISDKGIPGLVIKIEIDGIESWELDKDSMELIVGAGENWDSFVEFAVKHNLHGVENLSLIPGSVGAAPVQNIGAYGSEVKEAILWVEVLNTETGEISIMMNIECMFRYRESVFKRPEGKKYIITRVAFVLKKQAALNTNYRDVADYIKNNAIPDSEITLQKIRDIVIDIRTKKLPDVKKLGTAGSFFKNPIISKAEYEEILKKYPNLPSYPTKEEGKVKIPAAWLLDNACGFKGYRKGNVGVYKNQALVLVNFGNAKAQQIVSLAEQMIKCVKEKTGVTLEAEVQIVGN